MRTLIKRGLTATALAGGLGLTALALVAPAAESANTPSAVLYVSPTGTNGGGDTSCTDAGHSTVQSAVDTAQIGGTVVVCAGTYKESVSIRKQLTLSGQPNAVIDASGSMYGIGIGADHVTVTGMTVKNADAKDSPADGIVTAVLGGTPATPTVTIGNFATITNNVLTANMGAGIDVNSTSSSLIANNRADRNGIGINMVNDFGAPAAHNTISGNTANDNAGGCGLVMADHSGLGIFNNAVIGNTANR